MGGPSPPPQGPFCVLVTRRLPPTEQRIQGTPGADRETQPGRSYPFTPKAWRLTPSLLPASFRSKEVADPGAASVRGALALELSVCVSQRAQRTAGARCLGVRSKPKLFSYRPQATACTLHAPLPPVSRLLLGLCAPGCAGHTHSPGGGGTRGQSRLAK